MSDAELITDEMLSAYLDGELSEAERMRVDERLEHDEKAQRTVEELRGIREEIRRLPRQSLSAGFAARIVDQISAPSEAMSRPGISSGRSNRRRTRLAAVLAAVAALFLISIWGINYLPSSSVADRSTDRSREAEATDQPLDEVAEKLDDPETATDGVLKLEQRIQAPQAVIPSVETEAKRSPPSGAVSPRDDSAFGLIVDFRVDAKQMADVSTAWSQYKTPPQGNQNPQVSEFVIAGTPSQVTSLLAGVQARPSDIRGPSMREFKQRGLSLIEGGKLLDEMPAPSPTDASLETRGIKELPESEVERLSETARRRSVSSPTANSPMTRSRFALKKADDEASQEVSEAVAESPDSDKGDAPLIRVLVRFEQVD